MGLLHRSGDQAALRRMAKQPDPAGPPKPLRRRVQRPELGADLALVKRIPVGAGLAGGSSDGRHRCWALNAG